MSFSGEANPADIHLWVIDLDGPEAQAAINRNLLSADETSRAAKMLREIVHRRFVAARSVLRDLAGQYYDEPAAGLVFRYLEKGKPVFDPPAGQSHSKIEFNLSHSDRFALLGFSRCGPIGVDIEQHNDRVNVDAIAANYLSIIEHEQLIRFPDTQRRQLFFRAWVLKEAFMKCTGLGFSLPLDHFSIDLLDDQRPRLLELNKHYAAFDSCQFGHVQAPPGFSGAWAVLAADAEKTEFSVRYFDYRDRD